MRSTIDIDDKLMAAAKKLTNIKTKKEIVNLSLKELVRKKRREHLIEMYGKAPVDLTLAELESLRRDEQ